VGPARAIEDVPLDRHDQATRRSPESGWPDEVGAGVTRVLLVDDHRLFAESLGVAVDRHPDLMCVGTPATIAECLTAVAAAHPDVVLLDIYLPDGDGIDAIKAIRALRADVRVLVMTGYTDLDVMTRAATAGACGFLPKESPVGGVIEAIRGARDGTMLVDGSTVAAILARVGTRQRSVKTRAIAQYQLTERELEVLDLMGRGLDSHAVAEFLSISLHTCRGHQKRILAKLDAHSQLEAVVLAANHGLISTFGR
jgi:DNA-binding NarL/FixJ family response regulator